MFKVQGALGCVIFHKFTKLFGSCTMSPSEQENGTFVVKTLPEYSNILLTSTHRRKKKTHSLSSTQMLRMPQALNMASPTQSSGPVPEGRLFSRRGECLEASSDP